MAHHSEDALLDYRRRVSLFAEDDGQTPDSQIGGHNEQEDADRQLDGGNHVAGGESGVVEEEGV